MHTLLMAIGLAAIALAAPVSAVATPARCAGADQQPGDASEAALARSTICLLNRERTRRDMRALPRNRRLSRAALSHTRDMVNRRYFAHVSKAGRDVVDRLRSTGYLRGTRSWSVGENLAWGTGARSTPRQTVSAWMKSAGHRQNILSRRFREIGIGVVFHSPDDGSREAATYTTTFGSRR